MFVVLTKWASMKVDGITGSHPAFRSLGAFNCTDITGEATDAVGLIGAGKFLLCTVNEPQATADAIEAGGLGVVLWQKGDGPLKASDVSALSPKLTAYGVPAGAKSKITAGTDLATIQDQIKTLLIKTLLQGQ